MSEARLFIGIALVLVGVGLRYAGVFPYDGRKRAVNPELPRFRKDDPQAHDKIVRLFVIVGVLIAVSSLISIPGID